MFDGLRGVCGAVVVQYAILAGSPAGCAVVVLGKRNRKNDLQYVVSISKAVGSRNLMKLRDNGPKNDQFRCRLMDSRRFRGIGCQFAEVEGNAESLFCAIRGWTLFKNPECLVSREAREARKDGN